jgi:hypothetical protein
VSAPGRRVVGRMNVRWDDRGWVVLETLSIPVFLVSLTIFVDAVLLPIWFHGGWFDAGRPDFFYMADAFLHGRLWLDVPWRPPINDLVLHDGHVYVPFAPFPAFLLMPLVALAGLQPSIAIEPVVNAFLAGITTCLAWAMLGAFGVRRLADRLWLTVLFGFGTVTWNITVRGGVWHTAEITAMALTFWALWETRRERPRAWLLGLLAAAAFLTRSTLLFAVPYYAWVVAGRPSSVGAAWRAVREAWRPVGVIAILAGASVAGFLWYNWARFGSPLETGYSLASLPPFLEVLREQGLFSIVHIPMNLDYLFLKGPEQFTSTPPFFMPSTLGMSVLITSPALLVGLRALVPPSRTPRAISARSAGSTLGAGRANAGPSPDPTALGHPVPWIEVLALGLTGLLVLMPTLMYYGGGWVQFGYRYLLDSVPFWLALCAIWASRRGVGWAWRIAIAWSVLVNLALCYWAFNT